MEVEGDIPVTFNIDVIDQGKDCTLKLKRSAGPGFAYKAAYELFFKELKLEPYR